MIDQIELIYVRNEVRMDRRCVSINSILHPDMTNETESQMRKAVLDFIKEAKITL